MRCLPFHTVISVPVWNDTHTRLWFDTVVKCGLQTGLSYTVKKKKKLNSTLKCEKPEIFLCRPMEQSFLFSEVDSL